MEYRPSLDLGVVAIEKGAFWSPPIMVANFTFYLFSLSLKDYQNINRYRPEKNLKTMIVFAVLRVFDS